MADNVGGRPPKYKNKEEIEKRIEAYFEECKGEMLTDENGDAITDKHGNPVFCHSKPPTVTGLALALGFTSRQGLLYYQAKQEYMDIITRAKSKVEEYTEQRLFDRDGVNGAKFSLINNFKGWSDKSRDETDNEVLNHIDELIRGISDAAKR